MTKGIQVTDDGAIVFADSDVSPFSALARSFTDLYIENITEIAGPSIKKGVLAIGKGIGKKFPVIQKITQALSDKWIANRAGRTLSGFLEASATKVGYDGILEEMGEEQLGRIIRAVTGLEDLETIVPSWEDLLVEAGIFAVPGGVSLASTKIFRKGAPIKPVEKRLGFVGEELLRPEQVPVTPELLQKDEMISLFESQKNVKLAEKEKAAALEFLENRIGKKKVSEKDRIRINANLPDDFENFLERQLPPPAEAVTEGVEAGEDKFAIKIFNKSVKITKNPTPETQQRLNVEFQKDWPRAPKGSPDISISLCIV